MGKKNGHLKKGPASRIKDNKNTSQMSDDFTSYCYDRMRMTEPHELIRVIDMQYQSQSQHNHNILTIQTELDIGRRDCAKNSMRKIAK